MAKNFFSNLFKEKKPGDDARETPKRDVPTTETPEMAAPQADVEPIAVEPTTDEPRLEAPSPASSKVASQVASPGAQVTASAVRTPEPTPEPIASRIAPLRAADSAPPDPQPDRTQATQPDPVAADTAPAAGWFSRLRDGLSRTSSKLSDGVTSIFTKRKLDDDAIEELEDLLIAADLGVTVAAKVTNALAKDRFDKEVTDADVRAALSKIVAEALRPVEAPLEIDPTRRPFVILMVGVNGAGKTTTIGKLAARFRREGKSVMLAAGDTFRAAAIEQLQAWGDRAGAPVVSRDIGADAAGLAFDALSAAKTAGVDVLMIDTAGRLQNRKELMDELAKIVRVLKKIDADAPHATLLTLDATVGQNALSQAQAFRDIAAVSGIVMTKLDGTARGGVLVAIAEKHALPIHFVGVGEAVDDLQPFEADAFARALTGATRDKQGQP
ncbi:MAG: signal recognition particle-docking protein FtsY [Alphaproteobacteria bacterium]|nr:signal recognition particle-docking protein FtsY [Alphaproteobacteria bacterium]